MKWFELVFVLGLVGAVVSQSPCVTPNGENAKCISIYKCQVFLDALKHRTPEIVRFMRDSRCGYMEDPLVCCGSVAQPAAVATPPPTQPSPIAVDKTKLFARRGECGVPGVLDRVFGGNVTGLDEYPWMALLEYRQNNGKSAGHSCAGMIINERYILTAAHCIVGRIEIEVGKIFRVRLGEYNTSSTIDCIYYSEDDGVEEICADPPVDIDVEEAIAHPQYDDSSPTKLHDIGILRLKKSIKYTDFIKPICMPLNLEETAVGQTVTVAGWGFTEKGIFSPVRLKADVPVVSLQQCSRAFNNRNIVKTQMCAGGKAGIDSCVGDSGGPLMAYFPNASDIYLEGIVSFGARVCGTQGLPGVYTRVSEYLKWITDNIKGW